MLRRLLSKHKILRGMISYGVLWPAGCFFEQVVVEKRTLKSVDWPKCLRYGFFGAIITAPQLYVWVRFLSVAVPGHTLSAAMTKVFVEEISFDPYLIAIFFYGMSIMEGKSHAQALNEVRNKFLVTFVSSLMFWPLVQVINFRLIRTSYQVTFISITSFFWTVLLALFKSSEETLSLPLGNDVVKKDLTINYK